jgi:diketogulonate reductase-like aldo/keto reductase
MALSLAAANTTTLSNGRTMPVVGFGCAGQLSRGPIGLALEQGYRLFDTSQATEWYLEAELGEALRASSVPRSELFITTKLHPRDLGESSTLEAFPASLKRLHTEYVDAFLLHYPRCFGSLCGGKEPAGTWRDSWRALEALHDRGQARSIGVSNFDERELAQLLGMARVRPHLVQSWMDPLQQARGLRALCHKHGVLFQAYSTLGTQWAGQGVRLNPVLKHPVIIRIAKQLGRSPAQVALRWALQSGAAVIPRSTKAKNMRANLELFDFELSAAQMADIDALDGTDPRAVRAPPPPPRTCLDESDACAAWAESGECDANPGYMHKACGASCDTCPKHDKEL